MALTSNPLMSTTAAAPAPGTANPLTLQAIQTPNVNPSSLQMNPQGVINTLATNAPPSLTSLLMPLYQQLFSSGEGALSKSTALQGQQGVAQAQSGAQQRGLTGSSIEAGAMQGALSSAQDSYAQGYASLLGQYVGQYSSAAAGDVANQSTYYGNLAQALGQGYAQQVQQSQFDRQLAAGLDVAREGANSSMWAGIAGGLGSAAGGALAHWSDMRLKKNVRKIGRKYGLDVIGFEYDRDRAPHLPLPKGSFVGFMAHQVADKYPETVSLRSGYLAVDYKRLSEVVHA